MRGEVRRFLFEFIFNAVIEDLLHQILTATEVPQAIALLEYTKGYLPRLSLKLSAPKSARFRLVSNKDPWYPSLDPC